MLGTGFAAVMVKLSVLEVPPPGDGLKTVTAAVPALAMSLAGIEAVSWLALTNVVVRSAPFQRTTDPEMKMLPLTVRLNAAPPATAEVGLRPLMLGTGFEAVMLKLTVLEVPPPGGGLKTVTAAVPALEMLLAGIEAVSRVELRNVVARSPPFQRTTDPEMKLLPLTVRLKPDPAATVDAGLRLVMLGAGFEAVMLKLNVLEVQPPGDGL